MKKKVVKRFKKPVEEKVLRLYQFLDDYYHDRAHPCNITPYLYQVYQCFWAKDLDSLIKDVIIPEFNSSPRVRRKLSDIILTDDLPF